ncbi:MAG: hypothetical protein R3F37_08455 [Candidatus Competibacteraceae bacterium]
MLKAIAGKEDTRLHRIFGLASRRDSSGIARYGAVGATPKLGQKTSKRGIIFTEIA